MIIVFPAPRTHTIVASKTPRAANSCITPEVGGMNQNSVGYCIKAEYGSSPKWLLRFSMNCVAGVRPCSLRIVKWEITPEWSNQKQCNSYPRSASFCWYATRNETIYTKLRNRRNTIRESQNVPISESAGRSAGSSVVKTSAALESRDLIFLFIILLLIIN
jgi:hypothetical protein